MMGVGKTSIGRRLAKTLNVPFHDSDREVEVAAGCTVSDIFDYYGEKSFRDTERRTGVGAFINNETRALVKNKGLSVWLDADVEMILPRITKRSHRPQLNDAPPKETLEKLAKEYTPFYSQADIQVNCNNLDPNAMVESIVKSLENYDHKGL
jgi:shikimate kinase